MKNLITAFCFGDAGILVVDARKDFFENAMKPPSKSCDQKNSCYQSIGQIQQQLILADAFGFKNVIVCINHIVVLDFRT